MAHMDNTSTCTCILIQIKAQFQLKVCFIKERTCTVR